MDREDRQREAIRRAMERREARMGRAREILAAGPEALTGVEVAQRNDRDDGLLFRGTGFGEPFDLSYTTAPEVRALRRLLSPEVAYPRAVNEQDLWITPYIRVADYDATGDRVHVIATVRGGESGTEIHLADGGPQTGCGHYIKYDAFAFGVEAAVSCKQCAARARALGFPVNEAEVARPNPPKGPAAPRVNGTCPTCGKEVLRGKGSKIGKSWYCRPCAAAERNRRDDLDRERFEKVWCSR